MEKNMEMEQNICPIYFPEFQFASTSFNFLPKVIEVRIMVRKNIT